jgi:molybdenum cofactor cytidylyltransferase
VARKVGAVILAAGSSRRLGRPKQTLILEGRPLLQHVIDAVAAAGIAELAVVLGAHADAVRAAIALPESSTVIVNAHHESGQASSLIAGIDALEDRVDRIVVLLGDQPRVRPEAIRAVAAAEGPIARAVYRGEASHPVAFDSGVWDELRGLTGDRGARELLATNPDRVTAVPLDAAAPVDIDTADDAREIGAT